MSHHRAPAGVSSLAFSRRGLASTTLSTRRDKMRRRRHQKANLQRTFASTPDDDDTERQTSRRTIVFATTNAGKAARLREHLDAVGAVGVEIETLSEDAAETQRDTVREVALDKARAAVATASVAGRKRRGDFCVVAHDCGLVVRALNGFPGPYTKDFNFKVGGVGLLRLLTDEASDRAASWDETLVCVDGTTGEEVVFSREFVYDGEVAREMPKKWTRWGDAPERSVGSVYVPREFGFREPLADVSEEDYQRFRRESPSVWNEFADFVAKEGW